MTPVAPRSNQPTSLEEILAPHVGITTAGGSYRCTCLHTYEAVILKEVPDPQYAGVDDAPKIKIPDQEQRMIVDALHTQHQVERLLAAGVTPPRSKDPREDLRRRLERR